MKDFSVVEDNNNKIKRLVEDHFSLEERSLNIFNEYLESPELRKIPEYENIYNSPDLRYRVKISLNKLKNSDPDWVKFKNHYKHFCVKTKITYNDFLENRITIDKNKIKLRKAIIDFYTSTKNVIYLLRDYKRFFVQKSTDLISNNARLILFNSFISRDYSYNNYNKMGKVIESEQTIKKYLKNEEIIYSYRASEKIIAEVSYCIDEANKHRLPPMSSEKKLELVFSANFTDWFLCSTSEKWGSCLNLESNYSFSFWSGIPSFVTDKNRILVYITDGTTKTYMGIKCEKMISRNWIYLVSSENKKCFFINKGYPNDFSELIKGAMGKWNKKYDMKTINEKELHKNNIKYKTIHPIPFLWHSVINKDYNELPRMITVDSVVFFDNGGKKLINKDTYRIDNITNRDVDSVFYRKIENTVRNLKYGKFNYQGGLVNLNDNFEAIGNYFHVR